MKKIISLVLVLSVVLSSLSAFAQSRRDDRRDDRQGSGTVVLRDGRSIVRIEVGDDRDDRDTLMRVRRLEQAVRDLQDKVYELQTNSAPRTQTVYVCSGDIFHVGFVMGKATSRTEAKAIALRQCQTKGGGIFCKESEISCEQTEERI